MGDTKIQWTEKSWNPVTGCTRVSAGCGGPQRQGGCYAETIAERLWPTQYPPVELPDGSTRPRRFTDVQCHPDRLKQPLKWRKPHRVFVNSMSDLFHEDVPGDFIAQIFGVMAGAQRHTFQVLTKRPERMRALMGGQARLSDGTTLADGLHEMDVLASIETGGAEVVEYRWPLPNVWLGVSVEDQASADERMPLLLDTPAAVRFISAEPLLGPVDLSEPNGRYAEEVTSGGIWDPWLGNLDWLILGGESGPRARPMDLAWARSLVEQCRTAGVACFVKQLGRRPVVGSGWSGDPVQPLDLRDSHGGDPDEWPGELRIREFPRVS